jgi:hypothetical protein
MRLGGVLLKQWRILSVWTRAGGQRPLACQFGKDSTRMAQDVPPYEMSIF